MSRTRRHSTPEIFAVWSRTRSGDLHFSFSSKQTKISSIYSQNVEFFPKIYASNFDQTEKKLHNRTKRILTKLVCMEIVKNDGKGVP